MAVKKERKVALISGGGSGIGLAIAYKLADEGIDTVIADINPPKQRVPDNISFFFCDVTNQVNIHSLYSQVKDSVGHPDILICNAGRGIHEKLAEGDPAKWQQAFDVNVLGTLRCIRAFVPNMLKHKYGDVVIISSVAANQPYAYGGIYAATKSAIDVIGETLRLETMPHVRVVVISPGTIDTDFFSNMISGELDTLQGLEITPVSAMEIADCVWFSLNRSRKSSINRIVIRPTEQKFKIASK
jgi:NADP-dependent 3-hydroxy acid dehydrogenase YdfG